MNKSKAKGTLFETELVRYFHEQGFSSVTRAPLSGKNDVGDLLNVPQFTCEAKSHKTITLAEYMKELEREQQMGGTKYGCVIVKRRSKPVSEAYAVMSLDQLIQIIKKLSS